LNLDTKIKAILFDYGEVLTAWVDREAALARQASLAAKLGVPVQDLWHYLFGSEIAHRWFMGEIEQDQFWRETLEPHGLADSETAVAFGQELFQSVNRVNPEMIDLLRRLHGRYKLAVLSNASWTEEELTERLEVAPEEAVFTDDLAPAAAAAARLGIHAHHFTTPAAFKEFLTELGISW
jgi:FMN phosphatase YigB (HAD superfamily)